MVVTADELPLEELPEDDSPPRLEELVEADSPLLEELEDDSSARLEEPADEPLPLEEAEPEPVALDPLALVDLPVAEDAVDFLRGEAAGDLTLEELALAVPALATALRFAAAVRAGSWPEASCT